MSQPDATSPSSAAATRGAAGATGATGAAPTSATPNSAGVTAATSATGIAAAASTAHTPRSTTLPKVIALLGLLTMLVLAGFVFQALSWESGDRVLHLNYASAAAGLVTTVAAIVWAIRSPAKAGAIVVTVVSILINPIWLLLLIRVFG